MKTSNILLTIFASIIALYMLGAFTEIRLRGEKRGSLGSSGEGESSTELLPAIRYLKVIGDERAIIVESGSESSMKVAWPKGKIPEKKLSYTVQGDTLSITVPDDISSNTRYTLILPSNQLKGIEGDKATVILRDYSADGLKMHLDESRLQVHGQGLTGNLAISANNKSRVWLYDSAIDTLSLEMANSRIECHKRVKTVSGQVRNQSRLTLGGAGSLQFEIDDSSRFDFWNR